MTRKTTELVYLNDLRESGETNMFGAVPYILDEFTIEKKEAVRLLKLWMLNFNEHEDNIIQRA